MMKKSLLVSLGLAAAAWLIDAVVDHLVFYSGRGFWDLLLFDIPPHELYVRLFLAVGIFLAGALVARALGGRGRAEAALRASEARYRQIVEHATNVFYKHDAFHELTYLSPQIEDLLGYTPQEAKGVWMKLATDHPVNAAGFESTDRAIRTGEAQPSFPLQLQHREGREVWVEVREAPLVDSDGSVAIVGALTDITARKEAEEALKTSEKRFRRVIEESYDGIYLLTGERFELVNRRFCEITGLTPEEAMAPDFSFWEIIAPESVPLIRDRQERRAGGMELPSLYDFTIRRPDGVRVHVAASASVIEYGDGEAVLGILRDVTEQKELEDQLRQAQKMESIGRLSGGVAHDLNNLLLPILGYGELLLEDLGPEDARREAAEEIVEAGNRARDLVRQLLAFGRRQTLEFEALDLNGLLTGFHNLLRRTIRENIRIEERWAPDLPCVRGDRSQVEQVVMNLAVNAQDAMPEGGTLTLETSPSTLTEAHASGLGLEPGPYVMLAVHDTGEGMDRNTRQRIFEPFFTTKEKGRGTGLGLATVYGIVKQHGGGIDVATQPGEGTTFKCYFPVAPPAEGPKGDRPVPVEA